MPPLLPGADEKAEVTTEGKSAAVKMGTALIKALFGDKFGNNPKFDGIKAGLQNFNGFILNDSGNRVAFLSFLRFGQGEIKDEAHLLQNLESINALAEGGLPTPKFLKGKADELVMRVPEKVEIDGGVVEVPRDIRGGALALAQEYIPGTSVTNPITTLEQAWDMGALFGKYHAVAETVFEGVEPMRNPISLENLQEMIQRGLGLGTDMTGSQALSELNKKGSKAQADLAEMITELKAKTDAEKAILDGMVPGEEKSRREASRMLVSQMVYMLEKQNWASHTMEEYERAAQIWRLEGFDELPKARNHGDFHSGNMFAPDSSHPLGVMYDMIGWMGDSTRLFDLCQALAISCHKEGKFWPEAAYAFVQGVQSQLHLTPDEIEAFPKMMDLVYLRSMATRFTSMVSSPETQFVTKTPLELELRRQKYQEEFLSTGLNWAKGEFPNKGKGGPGSNMQDGGPYRGGGRGPIVPSFEGGM